MSNGLDIVKILRFLKMFLLLSKKKNNTLTLKIEDFRKVQQQNYCKIAKVSLKPFKFKEIFH